MGPAGGPAEQRRRNAGAGRPSPREGGTMWQMASRLQIPWSSTHWHPPTPHRRSVSAETSSGATSHFAGRLNVKIKVNGIRVNKTTRCRGNSGPAPLARDQPLLSVQSAAGNNTLLTEGHTRQRCGFHWCYLKRRAWSRTKGRGGGDWQRETTEDVGFHSPVG